MNLNQIEKKDKNRIQTSQIFVVNILSPLIKKHLVPKDVDNGKDHTEAYLNKLRERKGLRLRGGN